MRDGPAGDGVDRGAPVCRARRSGRDPGRPATPLLEGFDLGRLVEASSYRIVNSPDIVPISPPGCAGLGSELSIQFAHVTANPVACCTQMGSIGADHSCSGTYVPYLQQLANGFSG